MTTRRQLLRSVVGATAVSLLSPATVIGAETVQLRAQRLGWAGVRLQLGQANVYIDPLENHAVWGEALRKPLVPIEAPGEARFVLVTHRHPDHCDSKAIARLVGADGALVSATGTCTVSPGIRLISAAVYEPQLLGEFTATAVPAADGYGDQQVSWIVSAGGRRIIHCGDTLWHGSWWRLARQYGPFDAAFLPINGARFGWRKPVSDVPAVLTPEQAVAAATVLGAKVLVPIHYGVAPSPEYTETSDATTHVLAEAKRRNLRVELLEPGEWLAWS
jgi:L-ascorbate metabolism protein UlaG (beta-lactamase superfamily)